MGEVVCGRKREPKLLSLRCEGGMDWGMTGGVRSGVKKGDMGGMVMFVVCTWSMPGVGG